MSASTTERGSVVLAVRDLRVRLDTVDGEIEPVAGVSFDLRAGETLALVGESGAGKSMVALAVMRLVGKGAKGEGARLDGSILLHGDPGGTVEMLTAPPERVRALRGRVLSMVFQEPMTSLNPVLRVGRQVAEALVVHEGLACSPAEARATELLRLVGIADAAVKARAFPHELSGGMRQRAMMAMALACRPRLLIADEPTTALDVTVQAQVLDLVRRLQRELGMAVLFITHDLGVVAQVADRVAVMYAGRIVEEAGVRELYRGPCHPYTAGLLRSMPNPACADPGAMVQPIPGTMPSLQRVPPGCAYHPRCPAAVPGRCTATVPALESAGPGRVVRCVRWAEQAGAAA